jgi:isopenicillin-N epimerase
VGTTGGNIGFCENATSGINAILRSLRFQAGDVVVVTDHIYNAVRQTLTHVLAASGAAMRVVDIPVPVEADTDIAAIILAAVDERTRLVMVDHVASVSAMVFPVGKIVAGCRDRNVPVLVDGAHAPGMLALDLDALDADWYVGNCHKWLCAPKGAAFLRVPERARENLHPITISHNYGKGFPAEFDLIGTRDASAWLSVPAAIDFHDRLGGADLRQRNHDVAMAGARRLADIFGTRLVAPEHQLGAMACVLLPPGPPATREAANALKQRLWDEARMEVHIMPFHDRLWLRISVAAYNEAAELDMLGDRLGAMLR